MSSGLSPPAASQRSRAQGRVLIVDDNTELVAALHAVLVGPSPGDAKSAPPSLTVTTASRGDEALALAATQGFDVAIVDVKLPDVSGVDLIRPLRTACPFSEVVLITGFASVQAAIGALRSGAFAFVLKSFRPEELIATVEQALAKVKLRRERHELEARYRALVELTDVLVVGLDEDDCVAVFNRKASSMAGVSTEDAIGRPFLDSWIPKDERARMKDAIEQTRAGERPREVEAGFKDATLPPGAARRCIRWHMSRAGDEADGARLVYGIGIDVTERRALAKRAADAEAMSVMGSLALNLAHEIRNPLNAAVLQLHLLGRNIDKLAADAQTREALHKRTEIVGAEIGRLNRLLTEFLDLARPRGLSREPVHVGALLNDVLDLQTDTAAAQGIRVLRDIPADGGVAIGDREKLKQVVLNLVVNAIEAMKGEGTLKAELRSTADWVNVAIGDTGPGIAPESLASVFDPFFTTKEGGTGLGLSIVRKIVDDHAGHIEIESARGEGTRVRVAIPTGR